MAEEAFGEGETGYSRQEPDAVSSGNNPSEMGQRLMAHMLGLEAPGIDPVTSYYLNHSRGPYVAGQALPYPSHGGFTHGMNPVMSGDGSWGQNMGSGENYGMNYMYNFGEYGV